MLENRSFDSILGRMKWDGIRPEVNGLTGNEFNTLNGSKIFVQRTSDTVSRYNPGHSLPDITEQIYGSDTNGTVHSLKPSNSGFALNAYRIGKGDSFAVNEVMSAFGPDAMPVTYALANEYAIIGNWFSAVPGPTYPNRHFAHAATSGGRTFNGSPIPGFSLKTIFTKLSQYGKSWHVYADSLKITTLLYNEMRTPKNLLKIRTVKYIFICVV